MINWLTAIFGFLALYAGAGLVYVWTRPTGHSADSADWLMIVILLCLAAAGVNEWRARRAKRAVRGASD